MSRKIRSAVVAFALINLVVSAAFALPRAGRPAPAQATSVSTTWGWLARLFAAASGTRILAKEGSQMDPDGHHPASPTLPSTLPSVLVDLIDIK